MKYCFFVICIFFISQGIIAQSAAKTATPLTDTSLDKQLAAIRKIYTAINLETKKMRVIKADVPDKSAEGGESTKYFSGNELRKMTVELLGESGRLMDEYYFSKEKLVFYFTSRFRYAHPLGGKIISVEKERFYFNDGTLIRWLNEKGRLVAKTLYKEKQQELLADLNDYLKP